MFSCTLAVVLLLAGGGACAAEGETTATAAKTEGPQDTQVEIPEVPEIRKAPGVDLPKEAELRKRVQARWDAVVKRDFVSAYAFETPEYREAHTAEEYASQFGPRIQWHVAKVKDLRYDRFDKVDVIVTLDFSFELPGVDQLARTTKDIKDRWVFADDQWWRRQPSQPLSGRKQSQH